MFDSVQVSTYTWQCCCQEVPKIVDVLAFVIAIEANDATGFGVERRDCRGDAASAFGNLEAGGCAQGRGELAPDEQAAVLIPSEVVGVEVELVSRASAAIHRQLRCVFGLRA